MYNKKVFFVQIFSVKKLKSWQNSEKMINRGGLFRAADLVGAIYSEHLFLN
jgi:hypothetical protein